LSLSDFWEFELALGVVTALLFAGWMIVRQNRSDGACSNLQRLVVLEGRAFQDELNTIRGDVAYILDTARSGKKLAASDVDRIANTANSAKESIAGISNAMLEAIGKTETRLDTLQARINELGDEDRGRNAESGEISRLHAMIERLSKTQKLIEDRLSDEIRFNLERATIADVSLKRFANRVEALSERLNRLLQDYDELCVSVGLLKQVGLALPAATPQVQRDSVDPKAQSQATESPSQARIASADGTISKPNISPGSEPLRGGISNDQAA
jgi:hypothetical protein